MPEVQEGPWTWTRNGEAVALAALPSIPFDAFHTATLSMCQDGGRLAALFPSPRSERALVAVVAHDARRRLAVLEAALGPGCSFDSLTPELPQAQAFERDLHERAGFTPVGHPWLKPLRLHRGDPGFLRVEGEGIHEVAVGPVHAGVIEPGHFRFQCRGETVLSLEIQLGYQHRGARALLLRANPERRLVIAESIAGDTAVGHATAHCVTVEALAGAEVSEGAQRVRAIALELERLHNHVGDLGALCNDVGYLPGAAWFGRLRGEFLNLLLSLSGNRFGRSLLRLGGVRFGLAAGAREAMLAKLPRLARDLEAVADLTFGNSLVLSRFERSGIVPREAAQDLGLVGPVARASGIERDVRRDHPSGLYERTKIPMSVSSGGDVLARAMVRWTSAKHSLAFLTEQLREDCQPAPPAAVPTPRPSHLAVALVEGWRGEIVHVAATGSAGELCGYEVVDPSFHNWFALQLAMRGRQISDFPLCNKSFNLSYAGHDL